MQHVQRRSGSGGGGHAWAGGFRGGPRKTPRECTLVHWYPPGGGGGPKKRHLVLYKLAGFCTADTLPWRTFFSLHSSPVTFQKKWNLCKICTFLSPKPPFWPYFGPFLALFGGGDPLGGARGVPRGGPDFGGWHGVDGVPPFRGSGGNARGVGKIFSEKNFIKKFPKNFFIDHDQSWALLQ